MSSKVILLTSSNLGPYHEAQYTRLSNDGLNLTIVKTPVTEYYRPWEEISQSRVFRICCPFDKRQTIFKVAREARKLLQTINPDVVICIGYNGRYVWITSLLCYRSGIPCGVYLDGWRRQSQRSVIKEMVKRIYCPTFFEVALVPGIKAYEYAHNLGFAEDCIFQIGTPIDNDHFSQQVNASLASPHTKYFFSVSRLSQEKNIATLLTAYAQYRSAGGTWDLCIAGTGPEETVLKSAVPEQLRTHINWLGWVSYDDLPCWYQRASCFVLSSITEPWGLVVNEAMAAGLPILVSTRCGCQPDLCIDGLNGHSFPPNDAKALAKLLILIENMPEDVTRSMGSESQRIINGRYSLRSWSAAFRECIRMSMQRRSTV